VLGKPGDLCALGDESIEIALQGGRLELRTVRLKGGAKMSAATLAASLNLAVGAPFQSEAK
jgi:methionyl-tRNA formyltransferase